VEKVAIGIRDTSLIRTGVREISGPTSETILVATTTGEVATKGVILKDTLTIITVLTFSGCNFVKLDYTKIEDS